MRDDMIYIEDPPTKNGNSGPKCFHNKEFVHLVADTTEELLAYATSIGMKSQWLQTSKWGTPHFDVVGARLLVVQRDPRVVKLTRAAAVRKWRELAR